MNRIILLLTILTITSSAKDKEIKNVAIGEKKESSSSIRTPVIPVEKLKSSKLIKFEEESEASHNKFRKYESNITYSEEETNNPPITSPYNKSRKKEPFKPYDDGVTPVKYRYRNATGHNPSTSTGESLARSYKRQKMEQKRRHKGR